MFDHVITRLWERVENGGVAKNLCAKNLFYLKNVKRPLESIIVTVKNNTFCILVFLRFLLST